VSLRPEMYPVVGGCNSILAGFRTPVLGSSNTAYALPSVISFSKSCFQFQKFKMSFKFDLHLVNIELTTLGRLLHSTKFRTKLDENLKTPADHCIGYLQ
jgi:hypothetical protein